MTTEKKEKITTINPLNDKELKSYEYMSAGKLNDVIQKCHEAFLEWRQKEVSERGTIIKAIGKALLDNKKELASLMLGSVKTGQPAYEDEIFGPVAALIKAKDETDAFRIANDSRFGLGGGIFSKDEKRVAKLAANHFDTGMIFINTFGLTKPAMAFGGVKDSGFGREHGGFGMKEFVNVKSIVLAGTE